MYSFQNRKLMLIIVSLLFCNSCSGDMNNSHYLEYASCTWKIPGSYQMIAGSNEYEPRFFKKNINDDNEKSLSKIEFYHSNSTKESISSIKDIHDNFQMKETETLILVKYQISIRAGDNVIGNGKEVTVLIEKSSGDSVTFTDMKIEKIVSGCLLPL